MRLAAAIFVITGLMLIFNMAGINTSTGYILSNLGLASAPYDFANSEFFGKVILILSIVAGGGGIVIGFFTKTSPEAYLVAPLAVVLTLFVGDILFIWQYMNANYSSWLGNIVLMISAPVAVWYSLTIIEWWRGVA